MVVSVSHGLYFHTRLYNSYSLWLIGAPDDGRETLVSWGLVATRTSQPSWGCFGFPGSRGHRAGDGRKGGFGEQRMGNLWASVCKHAVLTMLIHFGWMRSIYYVSGEVWWMGSQVFPCIISALWSVCDLFSSIYGATSLKPKGKFIQPFPVFLFFPFRFCYISAFFYFFSSGLKSSLLFWVDGFQFCTRQLGFLRSTLPNKGSFSRDFKCPAWVMSSFKKSHVSLEELLCIKLFWKAGLGGEWLSL